MSNKLTCKTGIPTADYVWNPFRGCVNKKCPLHPDRDGGCWAAETCNRWAGPWAYREAEYRAKKYWHESMKMSRVNYAKGEDIAIRSNLKRFQLEFFESQFDKILPSKPCTIAVGWQSDFAYVPDAWVQEVINKCREYPWIIFQWLTKDPSAYGRFEWPTNCWLGFTACDQERFDIICAFLAMCEKFTWKHTIYLYLEPLLEKINIQLIDKRYIDWIIVGGHNNGPPMHPDWVRSIRDWCKNDVPFFFKQWGYWIEHDQLCAWQVRKRRTMKKEKLLYFYGPHEVFYPFEKKSGNILDGRTWEQVPEVKR